MTPLLSIIVPTKDRYQYLKPLILLVDSFHSDEIELVVQDNSINNQEILDFFGKENKFNCVKYFYNQNKLSATDNATLAVSNSSGEYICFIGDDDGVCRNIIDCVKWMKKNNIEAIRNSYASYKWGDANKRSNINFEANCLIMSKPQKKVKLLNVKSELENILKLGFQTLDYIPLLYHGIVKRDILYQVYEIGGLFFPGASSDISSGVSLAFFVKKMAYVDFPVIIDGASYMTGGGLYAIKGGSLDLKDVKFISQSVIDNWEKSIPRIWVGILAWAESGIKALRYVKHEEYITKFNFNYLFASLAIFYRQHLKLSYKYAPNKLLWLYYVIKIIAYDGTRVTKNKIVSYFCPNRFVGKYIYRNLNNIKDAEQKITEELKQKNIGFDGLEI